MITVPMCSTPHPAIHVIKVAIGGNYGISNIAEIGSSKQPHQEFSQRWQAASPANTTESPSCEALDTLHNGSTKVSRGCPYAKHFLILTLYSQ